MKITRWASVTDRGDGCTNAEIHSYGWCSSDKAVKLSAGPVEDFRTKRPRKTELTLHEWRFLISLNELCEMVEALGNGMSDSDASEVGAAMAPSLSAIIRIAQAAAEHVERSNHAGSKQSAALIEA